jgi:hypothetical protein
MIYLLECEGRSENKMSSIFVYSGILLPNKEKVGRGGGSGVRLGRVCTLVLS